VAGDSVSAVAIAPDSKTALAVKSNVDKVAILAIDNGKVTYDKKNDLPANNFPYNVAITPNGKIALIVNTGNGGSSDGNACGESPSPPRTRPESDPAQPGPPAHTVLLSLPRVRQQSLTGRSRGVIALPDL
jgi:hypothetical protein